MKCEHERRFSCLLLAACFVLALGPVSPIYSQEARYEISATELSEWNTLVQNSITECKSLRAQFQLLRAASGNVTGLSEIYEARLKSLENYVTELENSNANLIALSQQAKRDVDDLKKTSQTLRDEFNAYKEAMAWIETENLILWIADGVIGAGLIIYGLATDDMPLIITGGVMAGSCALHFVFDIF